MEGFVEVGAGHEAVPTSDSTGRDRGSSSQLVQCDRCSPSARTVLRRLSLSAFDGGFSCLSGANARNIELVRAIKSVDAVLLLVHIG